MNKSKARKSGKRKKPFKSNCRVCVITTTPPLANSQHAPLFPLNSNTAMPRTPSTPGRRIGTRASNKQAHPGYAVRAKKRRTHEEVQRERTAKAQAMAAQERARQDDIDSVAEFERNDKIEEGLNDATPRPLPLSTPRVTRNVHADIGTPLSPLPAGYSETSGEDASSFRRPASETEDDDLSSSTVDSSAPTPIKKVKKAAVKKAGINKPKLRNNAKVIPLSFGWYHLM